MSTFEYKNTVLHIDNVSLEDIANTYGTPTYVYSANHMRTQFDKLQNAMQKHLPADKQPLLCYACKANSNLAVLSVLKNCGSGLEIVSEGELHRALKAGFPANKIVSTGVGKSASEIKTLIEIGAHQINIESLPELHRIDEISRNLEKPINVVFRWNPDVAGGSHDKNSTGRKDDKFGISPAQIFEGFTLAKDMPYVNARGLSFHIGSQISTVDSFEQTFAKLPALVQEIRAQNHIVDRLDIGGGFPIQYDENEPLLDLDHYAKWVNDFVVPLGADIIMEPGRFLVGNSGVLLSRVEYIKTTEIRDFAVLDSAMNDLIRPTLYDAYHAIKPVVLKDDTKNEVSEKSYDVVGPICETGDTFAKERNIATLAQGDLVVLHSAGAYGFCQAGNYNTRRLPAEVLVNGDTHALIKPRQDYEDIFDTDIIPDWV